MLQTQNRGKNMAENAKKYAPGMRVMIRGEEWMIKKIENNTLGNKALYVVGLLVE